MSQTYETEGPQFYQIKLKGHLDPHRADWFDGMTLTHHDDGTTTLYGPVTDQAALYGLLIKTHDLGLPLLAVVQIDPEQDEAK